MKGYGVSLTGLPSGKTSDPVIPREGVESDVGCYEGWAGCPSLCVIPREGVESFAIPTLIDPNFFDQ